MLKQQAEKFVCEFGNEVDFLMLQFSHFCPFVHLIIRAFSILDLL